VLAAAVAAGCSDTAGTPVRRVVPTTVATTTTSTTTTTTTLPSAVATTIPTPVVPTVGWSRPVTTLPPAGGFTSLSCISAVFCLAAGGGSNEADAADSTGPGAVAAWDGATWSPPTTYYPTAPGTAPPPWLPAIACTDGPLCAVVDGSGHTSLGDGTNWWPPSPLAAAPAPAPNPADPGPGHLGSRSAAVSCPSARFCAYVDNTGHLATMHGTTWSVPQVVTTRVGASTVGLYQSGRVGVSCTDDSTCTGLVGGTVLDWDGSTWTVSAAPWGASAASGDTAVSCPVAGTCVAVHGAVVSTRVPGSGWTTPRAVDGNGRLDAVSCPSVSVCVAADAYGDVLRMTGAVWGPPQKVVPTSSAYSGDGTSLSCPSTQFCMVIDGDGDYATYQGAAAPTATTTTVPATTTTSGA
jgi:hypothetical protein